MKKCQQNNIKYVFRTEDYFDGSSSFSMQEKGIRYFFNPWYIYPSEKHGAMRLDILTFVRSYNDYIRTNPSPYHEFVRDKLSEEYIKSYGI